jgi:hypothetical protein
MGVDSEDKIMWMTASHFWGEAKDAALFTKAGAEAIVRDQNLRNSYLDRNDRVRAEIKGAM